MFLFYILLFLLLIAAIPALMVAVVALRLSRKMKRFRGKKSRTNAPHNGDTYVDPRYQAPQPHKIFADDEGEYVDFEEVGPDPKSQDKA